MATIELRGELENNSLWYQYKVPVWLEQTGQAAAIHNIMRTLRSIRGLENTSYFSSPITSGGRYYQSLLSSASKILGPNWMHTIIEQNLNDAQNLVIELQERMGGQIVCPADLVPARQKWSQDHFQALWLCLIAERCSKVVLAPNWQLSNGCVEEFVHAWQLKLGVPRHSQVFFLNTKESEEDQRKRMKNIAIVDFEGKPISIEAGEEYISLSIEWLKSNGLNEWQRLSKGLGLLSWTKQKIQEGFYQ